MKQIYNPYLPLDEYVPDGEPHLFDGRVYIYGSHDLAGGEAYCLGDYVTWSAPENDLTDWRYEGVIYRKDQDPSNKEMHREIWAPDVAKGTDGKYYLFYCLAFYPEIGVAVSDSPAGPFEFYGHIHYPENIKNGKTLSEHLPFEPAVLVDDDGKVFLYYGFSPAVPLKKEGEDGDIEGAEKLEFSEGAMVAELESDMLTLKEEPHMMIPGGLKEGGTSFEGHGFFEASSMRKVGEKYYFVYSSKLSHELCYAVSDYPDREFTFGGTLISNGDIGYEGNQEPHNMMGNNHGGMVKANGQWYIFYHRQTHGTESSRQGCAEKITIQEDGSIKQVEMTSCGLNKGGLSDKGTYPAAIACNLMGKDSIGKITYGASLKDTQPYIFEENNDLHYIANIGDGVVVGYKYFAVEKLSKVVLCLRGDAEGEIKVSADLAGKSELGSSRFKLQGKEWNTVEIPVKAETGKTGLFFRFAIDGTVEFKEFTLS